MYEKKKPSKHQVDSTEFLNRIVGSDDSVIRPHYPKKMGFCYLYMISLYKETLWKAWAFYRLIFGIGTSKMLPGGLKFYMI